MLQTTMFIPHRQLKEHTYYRLLQGLTISSGQEHGLIIDYYGNLENLDTALETYSGTNNYDAVDLKVH